MRILLLLSESWNDQTAPNNNMSNWFTGFPDAEIWTISGSSFPPSNNCCTHYFLISEGEMLRSLFTRIRAGKEYLQDTNDISPNVEFLTDMTERKAFKNRFSGELARLCRDLVWRYGKYDLDALEHFIQCCKPDIIFSQRKGSVKMCRMEQIVSSMTDAPMVAYTGDDEYSLRQFSLNPLFWLRRFWTRSWLRRSIPNYKLFYCQSRRQMEEFQRLFAVPTKFLVKCGSFDGSRVHTDVAEPIRMVYAGKLYCNRWKTLNTIIDAIETIHLQLGRQAFQLSIYTADKLTKQQSRCLNRGESAHVYPPVAANILPNIYAKSDIALHVEGLDIRNRLLTQDSFSTKVMDCMASGCAVMAVCWEEHAALQYLKEQDAAMTASSIEEIRLQLEKLVDHPETVCEYSRKAYQCGTNNHERRKIQEMLFDDFKRIVNE